MQKRNNRVDHQHLLVKQLMNRLRSNTDFIKQRLKQKNIDYYNIDPQTRSSILHDVISDFKQTQQGQTIIEQISKQLSEQAELVSNSKVKRQGYLIDCFREASAFPIAKERQKPTLNLTILHGKTIKKQLRRVIWSRMFNIDKYKMMFIKWDREVTPYKIKQELKVSLENSCSRHAFNLKENQLEIALRLVEFFLKAKGKLPQKYHFFVSLMIVELYSYTKIQKINEIGAVSLGIMNLLEFYNQTTDLKIIHIKKALEIVDGDTYNFIQSNFLTGSQANKGQKQLLQSFEMFKLTSGCYYLPFQTSQFIADQLIIRKKCKLDMYTMFAIMILIISDQFEQGLQKGKSLKEIIEMSRQVIKKQQYVEAYNVIYENIHPWYKTDDLSQHPNNRLLAQMIAFQKQQNQLEPQQDDQQFLEDLNTPIRIGSKA